MLNQHSCQAIVVTCIDFRLQKYIEKWTAKNLPGGYDKLSIAGAVKDMTYVLKQIDISIRLHHVKEVYLINHEDCGAYGTEGSLEKHQNDLTAAKKAISAKFPHLKIFLLYLKLDGEFVKV